MAGPLNVRHCRTKMAQRTALAGLGHKAFLAHLVEGTCQEGGLMGVGGGEVLSGVHSRKANDSQGPTLCLAANLVHSPPFRCCPNNTTLAHGLQRVFTFAVVVVDRLLSSDSR